MKTLSAESVLFSHLFSLAQRTAAGRSQPRNEGGEARGGLVSEEHSESTTQAKRSPSERPKRESDGAAGTARGASDEGAGETSDTRI